MKGSSSDRGSQVDVLIKFNKCDALKSKLSEMCWGFRYQNVLPGLGTQLFTGFHNFSRQFMNILEIIVMINSFVPRSNLILY